MRSIRPAQATHSEVHSLAALDDDAPLDEALRRAVAAGSLACSAAGAQPSFPQRSAVDTILERIRPLTSRVRKIYNARE